MWIQNNSIRTGFSLFSVFALVLWLVACGGNGGGKSANVSDSVSSGTGTVAVTMTDAPGSDFDEINVTVTRIQLLSDDGGQATIFEGNKTFDLLQLSEVSQFFAIADGVPPGPWVKVRLTLDDLELVRKDAQGVVIETFHPHLPGNGKLDLNPRTMFFVVPGEMLLIEIDMDAKKSILAVGTGNGKYQFRPVVFVNILEPGALGKIIRLDGTVDGEPGDDEFKLCLNGDPGLCVEVHVGAGTTIFDGSADAIPFVDLEAGDNVIVYARSRPDDSPADDPDDDAENDFDVDALVVEVDNSGTFVALTGTAEPEDPPMMDMFPFIIDPAQAGIDAGTSVLVQLQTETQIFSKNGDALDASAIVTGVMGTASGVLSGPASLKSTIIILDTNTP